MSTDMSLETASLAQLQQTPIERVMHIIDEGLVHLPTYRDLYYRWERQQWQAQEIDFTPDHQQWEAFSEEERGIRLLALISFFKGEECVTNTLAPFVTAMPEDEMRIFVTTQLVDEARHTIFFARFFKEALGIDEGSLEATLAMIEKRMSDEARYLLIDSLNEVAEHIRQEPKNLAHLVHGVTLYHIIIEGTMALAGQRNMLEIYRARDLFPAFRAGFTAVARDESRHVIFGVKFLRDMIQRDKLYAEVVYDALNKYAPVAMDAMKYTPEEREQILARGEDPWLALRYAQESLTKKLKVIGVRMPLLSSSASHES